jgi:hypothetical protein
MSYHVCHTAEKTSGAQARRGYNKRVWNVTWRSGRQVDIATDSGTTLEENYII